MMTRFVLLLSAPQLVLSALLCLGLTAGLAQGQVPDCRDVRVGTVKPEEQKPMVSKVDGAQQEDELLTIALSPSAVVRNQINEQQRDLDLLRKSSMGGQGPGRDWIKLPIARRISALYRAAQGSSREIRRWSVGELARSLETDLDEDLTREGLRGLIQVAVRDTDEDIRNEALAAWAARAKGDQPMAGQALKEMGAGLDLNNPLEKRRAVDALRGIGGNEVLELFITKITTTWGKGPRNHVMIAKQRSYIADYDVSGAVFDPVIRSFLVGVVLDTQQLQIQMMRYVVEEIRRLGADEAIQKDPKAWKGFLDRKKAEVGR